MLVDIDGLLEAGEIKDSDNVGLSFLDTLAQDFIVEDKVEIKVGQTSHPKLQLLLQAVSAESIKVPQDLKDQMMSEIVCTYIKIRISSYCHQQKQRVAQRIKH